MFTFFTKFMSEHDHHQVVVFTHKLGEKGKHVYIDLCIVFFLGWFHRQCLSSLLQIALGRYFGNRGDGEKSGRKSGKVEKTGREQARGNIDVLTTQNVKCLAG